MLTNELIGAWPSLAEACLLCKAHRRKRGQPAVPYIPYLDPKTIGEHIRKRRLNLGLQQQEVAAMIGVTASTVWNWEHRRDPELRHMPKIIDEFLGYVPFECPEDPIGKLRHFKLVNGLSYDRLGELMGRDPEQLMDWLSRRRKPCERNIQNIINFLS